MLAIIQMLQGLVWYVNYSYIIDLTSLADVC